MEKPKAEENVDNWSEKAEDLAAAGDTDGAISLLETQVLKLQELSASDPAILLQLASAHGELASLYSSKGFSLKADDLRSRAALFQYQASSLYRLSFPLICFVFLFCLVDYYACLPKMWNENRGNEKA